MVLSSVLIVILGISAADKLQAEDFDQRLALGLSLSSFEYEETNNETLLNSESGQINGGLLEWRLDKQPFFFAFEISADHGTVDYDGLTQNGNFVETRSTYLRKKFQLEAGRIYRLSEKWLLSPTLQIGYNDWTRRIRAVSNINGLREEYRYWFAKFGATIEYSLPAKQNIRLTALAQQPIDAEITVEFENDLDTTVLNMDEKTGFSLALAWNIPITRSLDIETELFYTLQKFGRSDEDQLSRNGTPVGTVFSPDNETTTAGASITVSKQF